MIHERKSKQILTDYHLFSSEWDDVRSNAVNDNGSERKSKVCSIIDGIHRDLDRLSAIISKLNKKGTVYTADDVAAEFHRYMADYSLFRFMENMIVRLRNNGRIRTSETYKAALKSFKTFRGNEDIMIDSIDSDLMEAYEGWHRSSGKSLNTVSFYNRIIRAVYNRALENEIIEDRNPFRHI